jgi:hypothetical protein
MAHNKLKRLVDGDEKLKLAVGRILAGNASGLASAVSLTGAITLGSAGSTVLGTNSVASGNITASAITPTKLAYANVSITILCSEASTTSAVKTQVFTSNAILMGIYLAEWASILERTASWDWKASMSSGTITVTLNNSNPGQTGGKYVFKGVVINP